MSEGTCQRRAEWDRSSLYNCHDASILLVHRPVKRTDALEPFVSEPAIDALDEGGIR
jgi:hypothetical protein